MLIFHLDDLYIKVEYWYVQFYWIISPFHSVLVSHILRLLLVEYIILSSWQTDLFTSSKCPLLSLVHGSLFLQQYSVSDIIFHDAILSICHLPIHQAWLNSEGSLSESLFLWSPLIWFWFMCLEMVLHTSYKSPLIVLFFATPWD